MKVVQTAVSDDRLFRECSYVVFSVGRIKGTALFLLVSAKSSVTPVRTRRGNFMPLACYC